MREHRVKARANHWSDTELLKLMHQRDYLHKIAFKAKSRETWDAYKKARNLVNSTTRQVKQDYFKQEITKNSNNSRGMWKSLQYVLPSKKSTKSLPNDISPNDLNTFFTSIGERLSSHFDKDKLPNMPPTVLDKESTFNFAVIEPNFILKCLQNLPDKKGVDVLGMDNHLLKLSAPIISPLLAYLFNLSILTCTVLRDWKKASVTPIYKGTWSKSNPGNFRPISLISTTGKIFESVVKVQLVDYFDRCSLISHNQSAYLHGRSTQTARHTVIDELAVNVNNNLISAVCALDMAKGFDCIPHKILLYKLRYYGFSDSSVKWFESYLSGRSQIVKYGSNHSSELLVPMGVPQGSILGPLLFILYVNDLNSIFENCNCKMYADDTTLYCKASSLTEAKMILQTNYNLAQDWLHNNQLTVNASKSAVILVGNIAKFSDVTFTVMQNNVLLPVVNESKLLGIVIDEKLSWKSHLEHVSARVSAKIGLIYRLSRFLPSNQLNLIYRPTTLVQPIFDYGITLWGACCKTYIDKLQYLQNRCARIVSNVL